MCRRRLRARPITLAVVEAAVDDERWPCGSNVRRETRHHKRRCWRTTRVAILVVTLVVAHLGCVEHPVRESVDGTADLDEVTHALTSSAITAVNGTYGAGCSGRSGAWSLRLSGIDPLPHPVLSVRKNNSGCVLNLTSIVAGQTYTATPFALTTSYPANATAFSLAGTVAFYANAKLSSTTFASSFIVTLRVSADASVGSVGVTASRLSTGYRLFDATDTPVTITDPDTAAVQIGVKIRPKSRGEITNIRFYKGPENTGTHVGKLWTLGGTLLGSVTFTGETASGWQTATFATPIAVTANTVYIATVHAPVGRYSVNASYFDTTRDRPQLRAPGGGASGCNGVYKYGDSTVFPMNCYRNSNYWVDVTFRTTSTVVASPIVQQFSGSTATSLATSVTVTLPAPTTAGNQVLLVVTTDEYVDTPAGFTLDRSQMSGNSLYAFRKSTSGGESSFTVTATSGTASRIAWWVAEVSGMQASPVDVSSVDGTGGKRPTSLTLTAVTPTSGPRLLVGAVGRFTDSTINTDATGYTNSFDKTSEATTFHASLNTSVSVATRSVTANGATSYGTTVTLAADATANSVLIAYKLN